MHDGVWNELSRIDILRKRFKLTYEEARSALKRANSDLIEALCQLEREKERGTEKIKNDIKKYGGELLAGLRDKVAELKDVKISLMHGHRSLLSFSAPMGMVLGCVLWQQKSTRLFSILALLYAAANHCHWEIEKAHSDELYETNI